MTACKDSLSGKKAVSATLAGVLAVGMVPAAAFAETAQADTTTGDEGVSLQFTEGSVAFSNGTVSSYELRQGDTVTNGTDASNIHATFEKNKAVKLSIKQVTVADLTTNAPVQLTAKDGDFTTAVYQRGEDGKPTGDAIDSDITSAGQYIVVVTAVKAAYKGGEIQVPFDIDAKDISGVQIKNYQSTGYTYDGEAKDFQFTLNGVDLQKDIDYTVKYVYTGHDATDTYVTDVKDAGTYKAIVTGIGNYAGSETVSSQVIKVNALQLTSNMVEDAVVSSDAEPTAPTAIWINGKRYGEGSAILSELKMDLTDKTQVFKENGKYSYTVTPTSKNIELTKGSADTTKTVPATCNVYKVAQIANFTYKGEAWPSSWESLVEDDSTHWAKKNVKATSADGKTMYKVDSGLELYKAFNNKTGAEVDPSSAVYEAGDYTFVYRVTEASMQANGYKLGGMESVQLKVYDSVIDADANAFVAYDQDGDGTQEIVTSVDSVYDGSDILPKIKVSVVRNSDKSQQLDNCTLTVTNADGVVVAKRAANTGKWSGKVTEAGTYTLKLTSDKFKLAGTTELTINIAKKSLEVVKSDKVTTKEFDNTGNSVEYLPWTKDGYDIAGLTLKYQTTTKGTDGKYTWDNVPMDIAKVTIKDASGKEVKKITDEGEYTVTFAPRNDDAANNYAFPKDLKITCIKAKHLTYADVTYTDWYADVVVDAASKDFMHGYDKTALFGPNDSITRGQVACVLYNMATKAGKADETIYEYSTTSGYRSYSDVDGTQYYGKAVAWAKQADVVNGYGDGTFKADQPVSREEFACMLANYAQKYGTFKASDGSALAKLPDAGKVSAWAKESVAWAVGQKVMGNGGAVNPAASITRAEAAAMVVNYSEL